MFSQTQLTYSRTQVHDRLMVHTLITFETRFDILGRTMLTNLCP